MDEHETEQRTVLIYLPKRLLGRLADGRERGAGYACHSVPEAEAAFGRALCGRTPGGKRSNGWTDHGAARVTCPRCLRKLDKLTKGSQ